MEGVDEVKFGKGVIYRTICPLCGKENTYVNKAQAIYNHRAHVHACKLKQRSLE